MYSIQFVFARWATIFLLFIFLLKTKSSPVPSNGASVTEDMDIGEQKNCYFSTEKLKKKLLSHNAHKLKSRAIMTS
jgi:hypothetical protein